MSILRRSLLAVLTTGLFAVALSVPALAYDTVEEARDAIYFAADQALLDMESREAVFEAAAVTMTTQAEVDDAAFQARADINGIAQDAIQLINQIKIEYPDQLNQNANAARTQVQEGKQASWDEIELIQATYPTAVPTTTTTIPAGATSTSSASPTTTMPTSPTTSTPTSPTTTSATTTTSTDQSVAPIGTNPPSDSTSGGADETIEGLVPGLPSTSADAATPGDENALRKGLRVFLPPAIAEFVATPFEIVGIVVRTTVEGGRQLLLPIVLLIVSCLFIVGAERRRSRVESA